jgi:hypothetical protein
MAEATKDKQILETMYDRLFAIISYAPQGKTPAADQNSKFQMGKNGGVNPTDVADALSPINPGGSINAALNFSDIVDALPDPTSEEFRPTGQTLSGQYPGLVTQGVTDNKINPDMQRQYDEAFAVLNKKDGDVVQPSAAFNTYETARSNYVDAIFAFASAQNALDLTITKNQQLWNAQSRQLMNKIDSAWSKWNASGKVKIETAQNTLRTSINNYVSAALASSGDLLADVNKLSAGNPPRLFLPSYASPTNWADPNATNFTKFTLGNSNLNKTASTSASSYTAGASGGWGLWSFGGSVSSGHQEKHEAMKADTFELTAELLQVRIMRPWYNPLIYLMQNWWLKGQPAGQISSTLPLVPTAFVVARNVAITGNFTQTEQDQVSDQMKTSASGGWGPFQISGSYSKESSEDKFHSEWHGSTLKIPGLQIIGWLSAKTPANVPPVNGVGK